MSLIERIIRPEIRALSSYAVAQAAGMIKLDAMENPFALPAALRAELGAALADAPLNRYPPAGADELRSALRATMGVPAGYDVMLGNGSDELIHLIIQACARPGAVVLSPAPAFVMIAMSSRFNGVKYVDVDLKTDFTLDLDAMLAAIATHQPAVTFLAYPNNPTGTLYTDEQIETILKASSGLVVVDEAYQPFAGRSFMARLPEFDNLLVMRTLSKLGLAGIRLGYMSARADLLAEFDKVRPPYNINVLTQVAAQVVLRHKDVLDEQAALLREQRSILSAALAAVPGVTVYPSAANFLLLRFEGNAERATRVFNDLKSKGILVKNMSLAHQLLRGCLRVTIGSPDENRAVLDALRTAPK
jgi:histidinol-phosphate aminotransferase